MRYHPNGGVSGFSKLAATPVAKVSLYRVAETQQQTPVHACQDAPCGIGAMHVHHDDHKHGEDCGHQAVCHLDHIDYLVDGQVR